MTPSNPYAVYQRNKVMTASPAELTLMLYDGAIKFCKIALAGIEEKDIEKAHINIRKLPTIPTIPQPTTTTHYNHPSFHLTPLKQLSHTNSASNIKNNNNHNMNIPSSQYNELLSEIHKLKSKQSEIQHKLQDNETRLTEIITVYN